ncbi:MAG: cell division protein SepF [Oscillospiraceae bacterium]|nr:cell division protein SepF [Oscillospiraceae bacterium]
MSFINAVKNFIGIESEEDYYDDEYYDEEDEIEEDEPPRRSMSFSRRSSSKVVPINPGASSRIRIMKPNDFEDSTGIADEIKGGRLVIFDVGNLDASDARRVVDFVSGAAYGVNGNVRRVSGGIFVAAPRNIDITGDNLKEHTRNSFDWSV